MLLCNVLILGIFTVNIANGRGSAQLIRIPLHRKKAHYSDVIVFQSVHPTILSILSLQLKVKFSAEYFIL